ncbi:MAG: hypothetical protein AB7S36_21045, partial [Planctomycetota bacterium]
ICARIPAEDVAKGLAVEQSNRTYCKLHRPEGVTDPPARPATGPRPSPATRAGISQRNRSTTTRSSRQTAIIDRARVRSTPPPSPGSGPGQPTRSRMPLVMIIGVVVILVVAGAMVAGSMNNGNGPRANHNNAGTAIAAPDNATAAGNNPTTAGNTDAASANANQATPLDTWRAALSQQQQHLDAWNRNPAGVAAAQARFREARHLEAGLAAIGGGTVGDREQLDELIDRWTDVVAAQPARDVLGRVDALVERGSLTDAEQTLARCVAGLSPDFPETYCREHSAPFQSLQAKLAEVRKRINDPTAPTNQPPMLTLGRQAGELTTSSSTMQSGQFATVYRFEPGAGHRVAVRASSTDFDTHLIVASPGGQQMQCANTLHGRDAALEFESEAGTWRVLVCAEAVGAVGRFEVEAVLLDTVQPLASEPLQPGEQKISAGAGWSRVYRIELAESLDVRSMLISAAGETGDVDMFMRPMMPFYGWSENARFVALEKGSHETIYCTGARADGQLSARTFYVLVANASTAPVEFVLTLALNVPRPASNAPLHNAVVTPDQPVEIELPTSAGRSFTIIAVDVAEGAGQMTLYFRGRTASVGLLLRYGRPPANTSEAEQTGSLAATDGRLEIVVPKPRAGRYYVVVVDGNEQPLFGRLHVSFD